jgi:hypothetical protein
MAVALYIRSFVFSSFRFAPMPCNHHADYRLKYANRTNEEAKKP